MESVVNGEREEQCQWRRREVNRLCGMDPIIILAGTATLLLVYGIVAIFVARQVRPAAFVAGALCLTIVIAVGCTHYAITLMPACDYQRMESTSSMRVDDDRSQCHTSARSIVHCV